MLKIYLLKLADFLGDMEQYWGFFLAAQGVGAFMGSLVCHSVLRRFTSKLTLRKTYLLFVVGEALFLMGLFLAFSIVGKCIVLMMAAMLEIICTIFILLLSKGESRKKNKAAEGILWIGISAIVIPLHTNHQKPKQIS